MSHMEEIIMTCLALLWQKVRFLKFLKILWNEWKIKYTWTEHNVGDEWDVLYRGNNYDLSRLVMTEGKMVEFKNKKEMT